MTTPVGGASVFGGLGKLEIAPANSPEDPFPYYVDITPYVRAEQTDLTIRRGRQSELDAFQPSELRCVLDNSDGRFTFGNKALNNRIVLDGFNRTVSNGFGTADSGQVWSVTGAASDYAVSPVVGTIAPSALNTGRIASVDTTVSNGELVATVNFSALPASGFHQVGLAVRYDGGQGHLLYLQINPDGSGTLNLASVSGPNPLQASVPTGITFVAGNGYNLRFNVFGTSMRGKVWLLNEPAAWTLTYTAPTILPGTQCGFYVQNVTAATTFTYGIGGVSFTVLGPLDNGFAPGTRVRYTETVGARTFQLFTGWLEYPDIQDWQPIGYQEVQFTATDRLARLARGRPFISVLAEHIIFNGGSGLSAYFPCNEATGPYLYDWQRQWVLTQSAPQSFQPTRFTLPLVQYAGAPTLLADELVGIQYTPTPDPNTGSALGWVQHGMTPNWTVTAGNSFAMVCWVNFSRLVASDNPNFLQLGTGAAATLWITKNVSGQFGLYARDDTSGPFPGGPVDLARKLTTNYWNLIAVRLSEPSGLVEVWFNDAPPQTFTLATPSTATFTAAAGPSEIFVLGQFTPASFAHLQFYLGPTATTYTRAQHLAQFQMAQFALEAQLTGDRVNTILNYAGVGANDRQVDPGVSYMAVAKLAGRSPADVLAEAVTTEQGRGFASGSGPYAFHDRQRVTNV